MYDLHAVTSLAGKWVRLRPVSKVDYPRLFQWRSDSEMVHVWNMSRRLASFEEFSTWLDQTLLTSSVYVVVDTTSDEPVGYAQTYNPSPWDQWVYVGFYLVPPFRGRPHFLEAAELSLDALFRWFPVRKVYAEVYEFAENIDAILRAMGFVEEGFTPNHFWHEGRYWGLWRFALYGDNWPETRQLIRGLLQVREQISQSA